MTNVVDCCAICLNKLQHRNRKLHTTVCGHVFHETCFEKLNADQELRCPYCRTETPPLVKQQINIFNHSIKELVEHIRIYPLMSKSYMLHHNTKIKELEEKLRQAKETKRVVLSELYDANQHNRILLVRYKKAKKDLLEQQHIELMEYQSKKKAIREAKKKQIKQHKNN